jgi:hypothetical protein
VGQIPEICILRAESLSRVDEWEWLGGFLEGDLQKPGGCWSVFLGQRGRGVRLKQGVGAQFSGGWF